MRAAATRGGDDGAGRRDEANDDEEERRDEADEGEGNGRGDDAETLEYFMGDVARGALTELDLGKYARLTTLRVVKCGDVVSLIGLGACESLRNVTVAECGLRSLEGASECRGLEALYAYGNAIDSLDGLADGRLERLHTLWLNDNRLMSLDGIETLMALRDLNVARNRLESVPDADALRELNHLNIAGNPIKSLAYVGVTRFIHSITFKDDVHGACDFCRGRWYRSYILRAVSNLRVLDGVDISEDERARASDEHAERELWYHMRCARIRKSFDDARDVALEHLRILTASVERDLLRARAEGRWLDVERDLSDISHFEISFTKIERRAREASLVLIARVFQDAEIVAETAREERFAFAKAESAAQSVDDVFIEIFGKFGRVRQKRAPQKRKSAWILTRRISDIVIASNMTEINLHSAELRGIPQEIGECVNLQTLILSDNAIKRLQGLPQMNSLKWLDLGNNHLWNSEDLNVLTTRARNVTSLIFRGNRKWLAKSKFYAPILVKRLPTLTHLDGIEVTSRMRAHYRVVGCRLNARAVRRRGKLYRDAAQSASEIVEFSLEDESLRKVELCGEFNTLIVAYLMNNCLKSIKSFGVTCRHLRHLSVEGNAMIRLDGLSLLKELKFLNVRNCMIKTLSPSWFKPLIKLLFINVERNELQSLSGLEQCRSIREIYASHNMLAETSSVVALAALPNLRLLTLYGNVMCDLKTYPHYVIFKFNQLSILDTDYISEAARADATKIYSGRLTEDMIVSGEHAAGGDEISLVALGLFHLDHNIVNARFQGIKCMNLENNNLSDVSALASLPRLTRLELRNNRVNAKFGRASSFSKLKYLDLSGNYISSLSVLALGSCSSLQTLLLSDNFLTRLDGINQLKSLRVLKVDKNKLSRIDSSTFDGCESLRVLCMRKNAFRTLKHVTKLAHVRELHLDENRVDDLEEISWLAYLTRLRILSLARNKVSSEYQRYVEFVTTCCRSLEQLDGEKLVYK